MKKVVARSGGGMVVHIRDNRIETKSLYGALGESSSMVRCFDDEQKIMTLCSSRLCCNSQRKAPGLVCSEKRPRLPHLRISSSLFSLPRSIFERFLSFRSHSRNESSASLSLLFLLLHHYIAPFAVCCCPPWYTVARVVLSLSNTRDPRSSVTLANERERGVGMNVEGRSGAYDSRLRVRYVIFFKFIGNNELSLFSQYFRTNFPISYFFHIPVVMKKSINFSMPFSIF